MLLLLRLILGQYTFYKKHVHKKFEGELSKTLKNPKAGRVLNHNFTELSYE